MKLKTVIIGAGGISYWHAQALKQTDIEIAGVYDISKAAAEKFAATFGTRALDSVDEILDEVDMADLYTPPSERVYYAEKVMNAGKHLFIEKPISVSLEDCDRILECAKANGVKLIVGFNHRYREGYRLLQQAVQSGDLGDPINIYAHRFGIGAGFRGRNISFSWRTDPKLVCGMSIESLSHDINMLMSLTKGVKRIGGMVNCSIESLPTFDNNSNVVFELASGGIGNIASSWSSDIQYSARCFIGTKGTAMIRGAGLWDFSEFVIKTDGMPYEKTYKVGEEFATTHVQSYVNIHNHFADCILNDKEPLTTGQQGRDALVFSHAILDSFKSGQMIEVNI
mgnify:CR=1 FL=1